MLGIERRDAPSRFDREEAHPMDATMHLIARSVQLAVMTAPSSSLGEAVATARRKRESLLSAMRRALAPASGSIRLTAS